MIFYDYSSYCPWHHDGSCTGHIAFEPHVRAAQYTPCMMDNCPIFYWAIKLKVVEEET